MSHLKKYLLKYLEYHNEKSSDCEAATEMNFNKSGPSLMSQSIQLSTEQHAFEKEKKSLIRLACSQFVESLLFRICTGICTLRCVHRLAGCSLFNIRVEWSVSKIPNHDD